METEEIINDLKKYELKHQETSSRLDFVVNDGTVLGWEEINTIINTVESLTKEKNDLLKSHSEWMMLALERKDVIEAMTKENKELRGGINSLLEYSKQYEREQKYLIENIKNDDYNRGILDGIKRITNLIERQRIKVGENHELINKDFPNGFEADSRETNINP